MFHLFLSCAYTRRSWRRAFLDSFTKAATHGPKYPVVRPKSSSASSLTKSLSLVYAINEFHEDCIAIVPSLDYYRRRVCVCVCLPQSLLREPLTRLYGKHRPRSASNAASCSAPPYAKSGVLFRSDMVQCTQWVLLRYLVPVVSQHSTAFVLQVRRIRKMKRQAQRKI